LKKNAVNYNLAMSGTTFGVGKSEDKEADTAEASLLAITKDGTRPKQKKTKKV